MIRHRLPICGAAFTSYRAPEKNTIMRYREISHRYANTAQLQRKQTGRDTELKTKSEKSYFPGRIIFHHQPKTAGQALNAWLVRHLGLGTVTPNLIGDHRQLIRQFGGEYPVLSGHLQFDGSGLDPRYSYCTVLREPIDRFVSWLFYVIRDAVDGDETRSLKAGASLFMATEGEESNDDFLESSRNIYVENFRKVVMLADAAVDRKIDMACAVAQSYQLVGFYDSLPTFVKNLADLIKLEQYSALPAINVTSQRAAVEQISPKMRSAIEALTELDCEFYRRMQAWSQKEGSIKTTVHAISAGAPSRFRSEQRHWATPAFPTRPCWAESYLQQFDAVIFSSEIGVADGESYVSEGRAGYLIFGGGISLDAGHYQVTLPCVFETAGSMIGADIVFDRGNTVLAAQSICDYDRQTGFFVARFSLNLHDAVRDLECRIWVPAQHVVRSLGVSIVDENALEKHLHTAWQLFYSAADATADERDMVSLDIEMLVTQVGIRAGGTIQSQGQAGVFAYGPYISLARGEWQIALVGLVGPQGLDGAWAEICFSNGDNVINTMPLAIAPFNDEALFIAEPWRFTLDHDVEDLEVRIFVGLRSEISLAQVLLLRIGGNSKKGISTAGDPQNV